MNYAIQTSTVGTVLWVPDQWGKGRRPYLVVAKDNQGATVCPLTHTPQPGDWATDELGRPTHIAAYNKFSGSWNLTWIDFQTELEIEQHRTQLSHATACSAIEEVGRQLNLSVL